MMLVLVRSRHARHLRSDQCRFELTRQLLAERCDPCAHVGGDRLPIFGSASVADRRRLVVALEADAVECCQRDLGSGLPRLGTDLPLVGPPGAVLDEEPVDRAEERRRVIAPDARSRSLEPDTPASNAALSSSEARISLDSSHIA